MPRMAVAGDMATGRLSGREVRMYGGGLADETLSERSVLIFAEHPRRTSSVSQQIGWIPLIQTVIEGISQFPPGWDGYGAVTPTEEALNVTQLILRNVPEYAPRPRVIPTTDGGIQIEWYRQGMDVTLEVMGSRDITLYWRDDLEEWEGPLQQAPEALPKLLWRFVMS